VGKMELVKEGSIMLVIGLIVIICIFFWKKKNKSIDPFVSFLIVTFFVGFGSLMILSGTEENKMTDTKNNLTEEVKKVLDVEKISIITNNNMEYKYKVGQKIYNVYTSGNEYKKLTIDLIEHNGKIIYEKK
jgi:uncharacterized membrane protein YeiB